MVYSTRRFVVCLSVCRFVLVFSVLLVLRLPRLGKRELILVLFVRLFGLCLFRFVGFHFLLGSGKGCGLWLWHSLDFSLTFFVIVALSGLFSYLLFSYVAFVLSLSAPHLSFWCLGKAALREFARYLHSYFWSLVSQNHPVNVRDFYHPQWSWKSS